jgi:hypothetical protein
MNYGCRKFLNIVPRPLDEKIVILGTLTFPRKVKIEKLTKIEK